MTATGVVREERKCPLHKNGFFGELTLCHVIIFTSILAFLFLLDILTTQVILRMGGVELNPLMAGVVITPILHVLLKCGILAMVIPVALTAEGRVRGSGRVLYTILIVMYTVVILNNAIILLPQIMRTFTG